MHPHAHPTEWALVIITCVGLSLEIWAVVVATRQRALFRTGLHGFMALFHLLDEWLRLVTQLLLMVAALFMVVSPPPPPGLTFENILGRLFLITVSTLLTVKSGMNQWARLRVRQLDSVRYGRRRNDTQS